MKVYIVYVEITKRLCVVAESSADAEAKAPDLLIEAEDGGDECDEDMHVDARLMGDDPDTFSGSIPYGLDNDDKRRDWTVEQWLAEAKS